MNILFKYQTKMKILHDNWSSLIQSFLFFTEREYLEIFIVKNKVDKYSIKTITSDCNIKSFYFSDVKKQYAMFFLYLYEFLWLLWILNG